MTDQQEKSPAPSRRPYAFAILGAFALVLTAWVARDFYQPLIPGTRAPGFEVPDLSGQPVSLKEHRGKVVLVNIWATWCPPCREEMPSMQRLYEEFQDEEFEILAISVDAPAGTIGPGGKRGGNVEEFTNSMGLTFPVLHDPSGQMQFVYQTTGLPESFLLDRDGVIQRRIAGGTMWDAEQHKQFIRRLLDEASSDR